MSDSKATIDAGEHLGLVYRELFRLLRGQKRFEAYPEDTEEFAEGCLALTNCSHKWDRKGAFSTYAIPRIQWAMRDVRRRRPVTDLRRRSHQVRHREFDHFEDCEAVAFLESMLTDKEKRLFNLVRAGYSRRVAARVLGVHTDTTWRQWNGIRERLGTVRERAGC